MAYQYIDTLSIPSPEEIDAINDLLDTLQEMLEGGDLGDWPNLEAHTCYRFGQLGVTIRLPDDEEDDE